MSRIRSAWAAGLAGAAALALVTAPLGVAEAVPRAADVVVTATVLNTHQVKVDWTSSLSPQPASWTVGRGGTDDLGTGPWSTTVAGSARTFTFNSLVTGQQYTFTVTPAGSTQGYTATATPGGTAAAVTVAATVLNAAQVKVDWTSSLSPAPASWTVGRGGTDSLGTGPWSTSVAGSTRTFTFNSLVAGQEYTFTVTPAGSTQGYTATATPGGTTPPGGTPGDTAGDTQGWGTPVWQDDFTGTAPGPDWGLYSDPGSQHGNRQPGQCQVSGGTLKLVSLPDRRTCGMAHRRNQTHGRWEARVRTSGGGWKSLFIIWPQSDVWPRDGEYDWMEQTAGGNCYGGFLHYPGHTPITQEVLPSNCVGTSQWHNVAFEWSAGSMKGWVDGRLWYSIAANADLTQMPAGHLTIQQDDQGSGSGNSATMEVDWVRGWDL